MMTAIEIVPSGPLRGALRAPSSKSATNRALVLASLADGESTILDPLESDDTAAMIDCVRSLGVEVEVEPGALRVHGTGGRLEPRSALDARFSGTTMRYLAAVGTLATGPVLLDGRGGLLRRSIGPLLAALQGLGARLEFSDLPPVRLDGGGLEGGRVTVDAEASSQFATAVLLVAPYARRDVEVHIENLGAGGFVEMTAAMMREWGAQVDRIDAATWHILAGQRYAARTYEVEYDASAAAHLFSLAIATGGEVTVTDARADTLQPDAGVVEVFERMGARTDRDGDALTVTGPASITPVEVDLRAMPDQLPAVAALAALSPGRSTITGVEVTRGHETNRIAALAKELAKMAVTVEELPDGLAITGPASVGARLDPHEDHRLAMAFAALGARAPGVVVTDPGCVEKTYPRFWEDAASLGLQTAPSN